MKLCNCCQQTKPIDSFYPEKRGLHGVKAQCKSCVSEKKRERWAVRTEEHRQKERDRLAQYRAENREKVREYHREWKESNPEKVREHGRTYRANHSEKIQERVAAWAKSNPEKAVARARRWQQRHPDRAVAAVMKRDARKRQAYAQWDQEFTDFVAAEAAHLCRLRQEFTSIKWHVDHIIPIAGNEVCGLHVWNNLQVIPGVLNVRKGNKLIEVNWR